LSLRSALASSGEVEVAPAAPAMKEQASSAKGNMRAGFTTIDRNFFLRILVASRDVRTAQSLREWEFGTFYAP